MIARFLPPSATPAGWADLATALTAPGSAPPRFAADLTQWLAASIPYVALTGSGRSAFWLILAACQRLAPSRQIVILPAYTCPVLAAAVQAAGLQTRLVDVEPLTFDYDRIALARALDAQTLAVVGVHPLGLPRPLQDVCAAAQAAGAFYVDDAAQALGARLTPPQLPQPQAGAQPSLPAGTLGDAGLFSFGPGKPLGLGGGGAALFLDPALAAQARTLSTAWSSAHPAAEWRARARLLALTAAFHPRGWWWAVRLGLDAVGDDAHTWRVHQHPLSRTAAALGRRLLPRLDGWNRQRADHARHLLAALPAAAGLTPIEPLAGAQAIYLRLPLLARNAAQRDDLWRRLRRAGIGAGRFYRQTLAQALPAAGWRLAQPAVPADFAGANELASRLLTLPTHPYVQARELERMLRTLNDAR